MKLRYFFNKVLYKILHNNHEIMCRYFRRGAVIGKNCVICSNLDYCDKQLLDIGDDVVISTNVTFVTHDFSISRLIKDSPSLWGIIKLGNNCFIGENSTILYGCDLGENTIVAAGSVVTKSFPDGNVVIGGNPAKVICTSSFFAKKNNGKGIHGIDIERAIKNKDERLVMRKNG